MLPKPFQYSIANANTTAKVTYTTEFTDEYFDVYSPPIRSQYAQVFWSMMEPVPLPEEIVKRFTNKTMAITGYESDQVMKTPQGDVPVPINHAYNHHYVAWLNSEHAELAEVGVDHDTSAAGHSMAHGAPTYWTARRKLTAPVVKDSAGHEIPLSTVFSEGNGGEYRGSYHGYPKGYAQLLHSPATFHINPMQIDTKNRESSKGPFKTGPLPKAAYPGVPEGLRENMAYSGLLECPCTDRIEKRYQLSYGTLDVGHCPTAVKSEADCFAAGQTGRDPVSQKTDSNMSDPFARPYIPAYEPASGGNRGQLPGSMEPNSAMERYMDNMKKSPLPITPGGLLGAAAGAMLAGPYGGAIGVGVGLYLERKWKTEQ